MDTIESHSCTPTRPRRRWGTAAAVAVATAAAALTFTATDAAAASNVNVLADEITAAADRAVAELDAYEASGHLVDYLAYSASRTETARLAARELGYSEFAMVDAWQEAPLDHQRAVLAAMTQVGVPYRRNTSIEDTGFDCSGLTTYAWSKAGQDLVRQSTSQIRNAAPLDRSQAKAGDLVQYPGHVMMYLGVDNAVIHSVQTGRTVEVDTISERRTNSVRFGDPTG
jgi:cell wall-associated NlpC family hydrolase